MTAYHDWTWDQGADLVMSITYNEGPVGEEVPVPLTGYSLRMDVVKSGVRVFTFNSEDIPGNPAVDVVGPADNEVTFDSEGGIYIRVPRSLTLPGGPVHSVLDTKKSSTQLDYDMFLRSPDGVQEKILQGSITVEKSFTLWP